MSDPGRVKRRLGEGDTDMKIEGSIALVTGANRGLGKALVAALIEAGAAKVYAAARDARQVAAGPRIVPLALDITQPEQIAAAAANANDVTLLVNNAGVCSSFDVLTAAPAELDADVRTNVFGTLAVIRAFAPVLERARGGATIVNVHSLASLAAVPPMGGYSASKAAAYSMTQALRASLKAKRIDVLAALPGPIDTDMTKGLELPKASPADVARELLAGVARGDEEIFPDPMSHELSALWRSSPKDLERALANAAPPAR
jgi:NAD(P)-dependent dehydrogenase (short-subunit alcohol dehydrogenase family)